MALVSLNYEAGFLNREIFYQQLRATISIFNKILNKSLEKLSAPEYFIQTVLSAGGMVNNIAIYETGGNFGYRLD